MLNPKSMKKWKVAEVVVAFLVSYESQVVDKSVQSNAKIADGSSAVIIRKLVELAMLLEYYLIC